MSNSSSPYAWARKLGFGAQAKFMALKAHPEIFGWIY
jgi:hypothetical protein